MKSSSGASPGGRASPTVPLWQKLILLLFGFLFSLSVVEIALRALVNRPLYSRVSTITAPSSVQASGLPDTGFYVQTPLGKRLRPNAHGIIKRHQLSGVDVELRTTQLGLRGPEPVDDARPRVLFLGDSITLADYLDEPSTFVRQVERLSRDTAVPIQALNAGVGSIGIEEEHNILLEVGKAIAPQLVLLNLYLNDAQASPAIHLIPIPPALRWSYLAQHFYQWRSRKAFDARMRDGVGTLSRATRNAWRRDTARKYPPSSGDWRTQRGAYNALIQVWFDDWGTSYSAGGIERMTVIADETAAAARALNASFAVVIHPTRFQVETEFLTREPQSVLSEHFTQRGTPVLDLLPGLRDRFATTGDPLFFDHCHHNQMGSTLVAAQISVFVIDVLTQRM